MEKNLFSIFMLSDYPIPIPIPPGYPTTLRALRLIILSYSVMRHYKRLYVLILRRTLVLYWRIDRWGFRSISHTASVEAGAGRYAGWDKPSRGMEDVE